MGLRSARYRFVVFAVAACVAAPAFAQQQGSPGVMDQIRGFFNRIFADDPKPPATAEPPKPAPVETRPPVPVEAPVTRGAPPPAAVSAPPPVKPSATAQASARSLHEYIAKGDYITALQMIEKGADVEAKDPGAGASALHYAVMRGRMPLIDLLLTRGADVNSRTRMGTTPLHTAVHYARLEVAELLLDAGADLNAQSVSGVTPLAIAEASRNHPLVAMLRARGAK